MSKLLTLEEEQELFRVVAQAREACAQLEQDDSNKECLENQILAGKQARCRIVEANQGLVMKTAKRYLWTGMDLGDLKQEGNVGLLKAIDRFDPQRCRFSTYAYFYIRATIVRAADDQSRVIRLPADLNRRLYKLKVMIERLEQESGETATAEELAQASELELGEVNQTFEQAQPVRSLSETLPEVGDEEGSTLEDTIPNERSPDPLEVLCKQEMIDETHDRLFGLRPKELIVLVLEFGIGDRDPQNGAQVGKTLGISRQRVNKLQDKALAQLRCFYRV